jgi:hypothetical protein
MHVKELTEDGNEKEARNSIDNNAAAEGLIIVRYNALARDGLPTSMSSFSFLLSPQAKSMGLLKGIDPLLTADLLHILRSMGHGNKLVVCDCNFPAGV